MTESNRLAKQVAAQFQCSRREATLYIEGGWIRVDGQLVEEPGARVLPGARIERLEGATLLDGEPATIVFHQPAALSAGLAPARARQFDLGYVLPALDAASRSAADTSGIALLKRHLRGLELCTALDPQLSGMLVLTQDRRLARRLQDEEARIEQEIIVDVDGALTPGGMELLNSAHEFGGVRQLPARVSWQNEGRLRVAIKAPREGQVVALCAQAGLRVRAMKRIRLGRQPMAALEPGAWRMLRPYERF